MTKKKLLVLLTMMLMLAALLLAGCGSNGAAPAAPADPPKAGAGGGQTDAGQASKTLDDIQKRGKLVVGVKFDTKLFGLKDPGTGKVEGFDIDMAKALAKKILGDENKVELKEVTSKTRIPLLKNGDIDMIIATMTITEATVEIHLVQNGLRLKPATSCKRSKPHPVSRASVLGTT